MPTIFFSYFLKDGSVAAEFDQRILGDVAPRALAEESVEAWTLHRINSWAGGSDDAPDYICVVDVADLERWSSEASASISESHGSLSPLVCRIAMAVSAGVVDDGAVQR
jgi:hypothetical protein